MSNNQFQDSDQNEDINEEEVVQAILELGNDILRNLGVEDRIDDIGVFFGDAFYIQFFQVAFPEIDFSNIQEASNEQQMSENLQSLIDLLGQQILRYDLSHITGEEIVQGNPEHCINLLQLVQEISVMVNNNQDPTSRRQTNDQEQDGPEDNETNEDDEDDDDKLQVDDVNNMLMGDDLEEEDDEAQLIHQKQAKKPQQNTSNNQINQQSAAKAQSSAKRGRSYSDDKRAGAGGQFDLDDIDISNEFNNVNMDGDDDDEDEDDDEHMQMFQQQQQLQQHQQQKHTDQSKQSIKQQQPKQQIIDNYQDDDDEEQQDEDDEEEIDDENMEMYQQFLAQNKQDQDQLAVMGVKNQQQNHFDIQDDDDDDEEEEDGNDQQQKQQQQQQQKQQQNPGGDMDDDEQDEEDIDLDNIDYDDLDPQILEIAEQMGVHPKEVLKQMLKMQNEGYGDEEDEDDDEEEMDEEELKQQLAQVNQMQHPKQQQQQQQTQQNQQQHSNSKQNNKSGGIAAQQQQKQLLPHEMIPSQQDSYCSEGELITRDKLADRQSYSAPYIIFNDCFEEKLCDTESNQQELDSAHTTTVLKNLEDQEALSQQMVQQAHQQQQQQQMLMMQQQQQQQQINMSSNSKNNKSQASNQKSNAKQQQQQQQQMFNLGDDDDEDEELDIDVGQKLEQLKNQQQQQEMMQQQQQQQYNEEDDDEDDQGEGEDDDMLVDLDQLDDERKQMLLEYLQQEYDKNPAQFPFPKEMLEQHQLQLNQIQKGRQDTESVRDIKSDEMIVEDTSQQHQLIDGQIEGGEEEIENQEDDGEDQLDEANLTPEQLQMLMMQQQQMQQHQQQDQDYGQEEVDEDGIGNEEDNGDQLDEIQQQMLHNYQMQQQLMMQQQQQQQRQPRKKSAKKGARPKSAGTKKKPPTYPGIQQQMNSNLLSQEQMAQQQQLIQQQQLLAMLQQEGVDIENLDPNILQQLIIAHSQQQQMNDQLDINRPKSGKRKTSQSRKKTTTTTSTINKTATNKNLTKLQPYQMPKSMGMKVLGPITPSTQYKSFNTNRSYNQTFSKKKPKKVSTTKKQALTVNPSQQQYMGIPQEQIDPNNIMMMQQQQQLLQQQQQQQQQVEMPVLSEEYLNQLSEEQLQQLLEHQQQLMIMQQQQQFGQQNSQMKKSIRPKSAKSSKTTNKTGKVPQTYANFYQPYMNNMRKKQSTMKGKKKKKTKQQMYQQQMDNHQGVLMNNYFPALEAGNQLISNSQLTEDGQGNTITKDQKYPKFSHDIVNNPNALAAQMTNNGQDPIDEVSQEMEDGESQQDHIQKMSNLYHNPGFMHPQQEMNNGDDGAGDDNEDNDGQVHQDQDIGQYQVDQDQQDPHDGYQEQEGYDPATQDQVDLTDEQLIQLIQNAHNLTPEQQVQLQLILQQKMKNEIANDRAKSYQDIYSILMDNVKKAKERLAPLGQPIMSIDGVEETDRRIMRQKQEFEALYKQYHHDMKHKEQRKRQEDSKTNKKLQREIKVQQIKEKKFHDELLNHQKSLNYKRNAQQVRLCQKVYKLASELEKNKLLAEKKEFKENLIKKKQQSKVMVDALENFYKNMISMLKEKIENEKFERRIASQAQQQAMSRMKRELNQQKKQEVERHLQLLRQEDQKYDFESTNVQRMEHEIVKLYKK